MDASDFFLRTIESFNLTGLVFPVFFVIGLFLSLFLYWRECKHELIKSEEAFDAAIVTGSAALLFSRIFEFVVHYEFYQWSFAKFFFFNVFPGIDFWGALVGAGIGAYFISRQKKLNFFQIMDLQAAPVIFLLSALALGRFVSGLASNELEFIWLYFGLGYFISFFVIKRLGSLKRHKGFFVSFLVVSVSFVNIILFKFRDDVTFIGGYVPYEFAAPLVFFIFGTSLWYWLAKRKIKKDVKNLFAFVLLLIFKTKRVLTSLDEADNLSKTIVLAPYLMFKRLLILLKYLGRELMDSLFDFLYTLGVRK